MSEPNGADVPCPDGDDRYLRAELVTPVQDWFDEMLTAGIERYNAEQARPIEPGHPLYGEYCERHGEEMQDHDCPDGPL